MARRDGERGTAGCRNESANGASPAGNGSVISAFIALDRDWKIIYIDGPASPGSARQRQDLTGANFWETFPAIIGTPFDHCYREAVATGKPAEIEAFYPPFQMWLHVSAYPSERGLSLYFRDVSERRLAERNIERERERLALAQKVARIGTFEWDIANDHVVWTPELEALYGLPPGGFEGRYEDWARRVHPDDMERATATLQAAVAGGTTWHEDFRILWPNGSIRWMHASAEVYRDNGQPVRVVGINLDSTERVLIEENLDFLAQASTILSSSLDYETTLAQVARLGVPRIADWCAVDMRTEGGDIKRLAVAHVDPEKVEWARELNRMNPPDPDAPTGVPHVLRTGKPEFYAEITDAMLAAAARDEEELALVRKIGFSSAIVAPMRVQDETIGAITFVSAESGRHYTQADLAMAEEVANRAALAVENARLYRDARRAIAVRDEFMSLASHELKTPVTSLKMYTQVLRRQAERREEAEMTERFMKMERQIDKLTGLINDLLNVARIEGGRLDYRDESFDLNAVVREAVDAVQPTTEKHTIVIEGAIDAPIWGDSERIEQVVTNLLTNAVKYSPQGERVIVRLARECGSAIISVQDFGIGIDAGHLERIFDQFYRVSDPSEKTFPGLGLGLYIASEIVKRHGGTLRVQSAKDVGATFTVALPLARAGRAGTTSAS